NPIQDLERRTGRHALALLVLSLTCAPLNALFKWKEPLKHRRALGLYAFMYAAVHVIIFVDLDFGLAWSRLLEEIFNKNYLIAGAAAFFLLVPLAITSFDVWKTRLGKNWKRLHQTVYFTAPLAALHYLWSKKGDILALQGEILQPALYGAAILLLLLLRTPALRKAFGRSR
ncbi:MAG: sulfoxide reductase heme-binding subunit YedZ, partial [Chloroflexi bacterium]|nr:sulfoxide reductase heme-binding subunit YedZ [Chloroflexota bacterium]